jgi:calcineurin-like phosphoesterase family protein
MKFYISDTHFGHQNIIRYDNRPFSTADEMDEALIDRWNDVVSDEDTVYVLGDFSWYREEKTLEILDSLSGHKVLIKGNHDRVSPKIARRFDKVCDYLEITDGKERVVMSHYPMPFWNGQFRNTVHLYGHVHNSHQWNVCESLRKELKALQDIPMRMVNVGCMMEWMDYTPQPLHVLTDSLEQEGEAL